MPWAFMYKCFKRVLIILFSLHLPFFAHSFIKQKNIVCILFYFTQKDLTIPMSYKIVNTILYFVRIYH